MLALNAGFIIAYFFRFHILIGGGLISSYRGLLVTVNALFLLILFSRRKEMIAESLDLRKHELLDARVNYAIFTILYLAVMVFTEGYVFSRIFHLYFLCSFGIVYFLDRIFAFPVLRDKVLSGNKRVKVVLVGAGDIGRKYLERIKRHQKYYDVVAVLDDDLSKKIYFNGEFRGKIDMLSDVLRTHRIDEVIVAIPTRETKKINQIVQTAERHYSLVKVIPGYSRDLSWRKLHVEEFSGMFMFSVENSRLKTFHNKILKRTIDILLSLAVLVFIFPLLCLVIVPLIKFSSKGPVFFRQKRKGFRGREFVCLKFRTMKIADRECQAIQTKKNDPRKTKVGDFLRKTSLDELPQFWNVFKGDMSVVGPRPHMVEHDEMYGKIIEDYHARLYVRPGVTGWAQVNGYRGNTENHELMSKRIEHDIWYIENWSPWLDIKIVLMTIAWMLKGDPNAY